LGDGSAKSYPSGIDFADHNQPFLLYDDKLLRVRRFDPESIPVTSSGNSSEDDAVETGLTEDNCKEWGYVDFNGAI
jgi:hypothetical protein